MTKTQRTQFLSLKLDAAYALDVAEGRLDPFSRTAKFRRDVIARQRQLER